MDAKTQEMLIGLGKDWLAGGVSAGVSKTAVAPIGKGKRMQNPSLHRTVLEFIPWLSRNVFWSIFLFSLPRT
jgi:hypothetical protein